MDLWTPRTQDGNNVATERAETPRAGAAVPRRAKKGGAPASIPTWLGSANKRTEEESARRARGSVSDVAGGETVPKGRRAWPCCALHHYPRLACVLPRPRAVPAHRWLHAPRGPGLFDQDGPVLCSAGLW